MNANKRGLRVERASGSDDCVSQSPPLAASGILGPLLARRRAGFGETPNSTREARALPAGLRSPIH